MKTYIDAKELRRRLLEHKRNTAPCYERHNEIVQCLAILDKFVKETEAVPKRFQVFVKADYVRDAQAYWGNSVLDDIWEEEYEQYWKDCDGDLLILDGKAKDIDDVKETLKRLYPDANENIFRIQEMVEKGDRNGRTYSI